MFGGVERYINTGHVPNVTGPDAGTIDHNFTSYGTAVRFNGCYGSTSDLEAGNADPLNDPSAS